MNGMGKAESEKYLKGEAECLLKFRLHHAVKHGAAVLTAFLLLQQQTFPYSFSFVIYIQFVEIDS